LSEEQTQLNRLLWSYRISQAIHVAAVLGIADLLADGPRSAAELAEATGTHPDTLYRLLRALAGAGVFHDWEDDGSLAILRSVRRAIPQTGTLLVVDRVLGGPNATLESKLADLNMLVLPGGRERSLDEFRSLFAGAGFELVGSTPTASPLEVIEARPVQD
jgi:DNA-binding transcriptional ArsR family regulator